MTPRGQFSMARDTFIPPDERSGPFLMIGPGREPGPHRRRSWVHRVQPEAVDSEELPAIRIEMAVFVLTPMAKDT